MKENLFTDFIDVFRRRPSVNYNVTYGGVDANEWFINHLENEKDFLLCAGELAFVLTNDVDITGAIRKAAGNGKEIRIICGPLVLYYLEENRGNTNQLIELLNTSYNEIKFNFKLYLTNPRVASGFHFAMSGNDVIFEHPHLPSDLYTKQPSKAVDDSFLLKRQLRAYFDHIVNGSIEISKFDDISEFLISDEELFDEDVKKLIKDLNNPKAANEYIDGNVRIYEKMYIELQSKHDDKLPVNVLKKLEEVYTRV